MIDMSIAAASLLLFAVLLDVTNGFGGFIPQRPCQNMIDFVIGFPFAILVLNALYLAGALDKVIELKHKLNRK